MTTLPVVASRAAFDAALQSARQVGLGGVLDGSGLPAPLDAALQGRIEDAWSAIESALISAFQFGKDRADAGLEVATKKVEDILSGAGAKAREVQDVLLRRLQQYAQTFVDRVLEQMPVTLGVGGNSYGLLTVRCTRKVLVTGSIKANLAEVVALTANGEIQIEAEYGTRAAP